jgi:chromosome segregation ATPase
MKNIPTTDQNLNKIDKRINNLESGFKNLESGFKNLEKRQDNLTIEVINIKEDVQDIKEKMVTKDDMSIVITALDRMSKRYESHEIEHASNLAAHERLQEQINDIKKKVGMKVKA